MDELTFRRIGDDASRDGYVLRDANNNVIALTDANQQSQTQYSYEPYGATTQTGVADPSTQQYTGRENDGTGLYYYRSRYYSPATGRFISEDPIGWASGQTNAYAYVGGNPVQFNDSRGTQRGRPKYGDPGTRYVHPITGDMRVYGPDGMPSLDIDVSHSHSEMCPHIHVWRDGVRGSGEAPF
ncbi:MAG TPA: RHS repeat-associated core domain-containing protein [Paraburkholderia sp.]|uniref:RHS repeat-associated core domain-containing protein n=1 Tax=Paraburkholderia sp. TaxID=1926495 RepID=UPI002ED475EA